MTQVRTETLRLLDGQRQEGIPPSVAVLTAPLHPARARQEETFLMLLDLTDASSSWLFRRVREEAAQTFWATEASVTAALRRAVAAANGVLSQHNLRSSTEQRCYGALSCAALKGHELFLAQAGPAFAYALCGGAPERFLQEGLPPLGAGPHAEVRIVYLTFQPGDVLILASQGLARSASEDALRRALALAEMEAVLEGLERVGAGEDFTALLVRWEAEKIAAAPPPRPRRHPSPPPPVEEPVAVIPIPVREESQIEATAIVSEVEPSLPEVEEPPVRVWEMEPEEEMEIPPWQRVAERPSPLRRPPRPSGLRLGRRLRGLGGGIAAAANAVGRGVQALFLRTLPGRERRVRARPRREPRPPPPENPRLMAGVALFIVFLVAVLTLTAWSTYSGSIRRQRALDQAHQHIQQALQATDPAVQHSHWEAVLTTLAGMSDEPEAASLKRQAQEALDRLDGVIRIDPILLRDFGSDFSARRLVVHGTSLFLLDVERQEVILLPLDETGEGVTGESAPAILRGGEEREGQHVAALVDMAWNRAEGGWTTNALVVLDESGRLWVYDPAWPEGVYPLFLGPTRGEGAIEAMAAFDGRLYLLAPMANQIWRYRPRDGGYPDQAEPYFPTSAPEPLAEARDLAIDGSIYTLFEDGRVAKYFEGQAVPFQVANVPTPSPHFVALAVDILRADGLLYLADRPNQRIVILSSGGEFHAQLCPPPDVFRSLDALALDDTGSRLYVLSGGQLYVVRLPLLP